MNQFGGDWTQQKVDIVYKYASAYLTVFKNKPSIKLLYFDGFAGTGEIKTKGSLIEGAAIKVLGIDQPRRFDTYYFVELDADKCMGLKEKANAL
jgi:three-Cys-motif partner protein